jgi:hypothetical protein
LKGPYIAGRAYDAVMFIGAPLLALGIGALISGTPLADQEITLWGHEETATQIFIGAFIMAHLVLVGARSHLNAAIFARHRWRFVAAPLAVMGLLCASEWALAIAMVVVVWWDVVHSSMQTFGLGRIYDARRGNPPALGRRLDIGLNLVLYMGPLLGGVTLVEHLDSLGALDEAAGGGDLRGGAGVRGGASRGAGVGVRGDRAGLFDRVCARLPAAAPARVLGVAAEGGAAGDDRGVLALLVGL